MNLHELVASYDLEKIKKMQSIEVTEAIFNEAVRMCAKKKETLLINILLPYTDLDNIRVVECEIPWLMSFLVSKGVVFKKGYNSQGFKYRITYDGDVLTLHDCVYRVPKKYF